MFFSPDPTPFPGTGELCSNHFFQNITFVSFIFFCFFLGFKLGDRSHISWIDVIINYKWYEQGKIWYNNFFLFLNTAICDFFLFFLLRKQDGSFPVCKFSWDRSYPYIGLLPPTHPPQDSIRLFWEESSKVDDDKLISLWVVNRDREWFFVACGSFWSQKLNIKKLS